MTLLILAGIAVTVVAAAFFAGTEMGAYSLNRIRLRVRADHGDRAAKWLMRMVDAPQQMLYLVLVGTNLSVYLASTLATALASGQTAHQAELKATLILTPILFLFAEVTPKALFQRTADDLMYRCAWLLHLFERLLKPVTVVLHVLISALDWVFHRPTPSPLSLSSRRQLRAVLCGGELDGFLTPGQSVMAGKILDLQTVPVPQAMVPMADVTSLGWPLDPDEILALARRCPFSRYPVLTPDGSDVQGVLHLQQFLAAHRASRPDSVQLHAPTRLRYDDSVMQCLSRLQRAGQPMGIVVDASDQPMGIVTIKDLVEEVTGELHAW